MIQIIIKVDLNKTMKRIDEKIQMLDQGVHEAGFLLEAEIKKDIASYPSVDTGRFMGSIQTDVSKPFQSIVFTNVEYAKFLEFGTSPHFIAPVNKKALRWKGGTEWFFSKGHMVSGIKPRRHFGNTSLKMKGQIIKYIEDKVKAIE